MKTKWKQNGNKMETKWKQNEDKMETKWKQNGNKMETKQKQNENKMKTKWKQNGNKMETKWKKMERQGHTPFFFRLTASCKWPTNHSPFGALCSQTKQNVMLQERLAESLVSDQIDIC